MTIDFKLSKKTDHETTDGKPLILSTGKNKILG